MSDSDPASSLSGCKRAASPTNAVAEAPAQRQRLSASIAAAVDPASAVRPPLSAAQRCAADALTLVFDFSNFEDLLCAAQACCAWSSAAAKEKPRGLTFERSHRLAALCSSSSPFRRHIARISADESLSFSLMQLAQLSQLPQLTALDARLSTTALTRLVQKPEEGGGALDALKAAFPPQLRQLTLRVPKGYSTAVRQLLLDALPVMAALETLSLIPADDEMPDRSTVLSFEPLLKLPSLTHLTWTVDVLTVSQLLIIKQVATLRFLDQRWFEWTAQLLSALCRPPHRLHQLKEVNLRYTDVDKAAMAELVRLPALTALEPNFLAPGAFAHLPRFSRLQRLRVRIDNGDDDHQQENEALLVSALSACPTLTKLTLRYGDCTESFGDQLVQAVPRLRTLSLERCSVPSLRFLRHAPNMEELFLSDCIDVRPGHVIGIGAFAPQLQSLHVDCCGRLLDEDERRLMTPPAALQLGLAHLREFRYRGHRPRRSDDEAVSDEDDESDPDLSSPH